MSGMKFDERKPASYLLAHDVLCVENDIYEAHTVDELAENLRSWWNRAGGCSGLCVTRSDYFGVVKVLEFGAQKYAPRNWEIGIAYSRVFRAAMDHYARMPELDDETGLPHRHHFLCCYMFLATYCARGLHQYDDRPGVGPFYSERDAHILASKLSKSLKRVTIIYDEPLSGCLSDGEDVGNG